MSYRIVGPRCTDCPRPLYAAGLCRPCWDLARAVHGTPTTTPDGDVMSHRSHAFDVELNRWLRGVPPAEPKAGQS